MVAFGRTLDDQAVAEWQPAYMDYKMLKSDLKRVPKSSSSRSPGTPKAPILNRPPTLSTLSRIMSKTFTLGSSNFYRLPKETFEIEVLEKAGSPYSIYETSVVETERSNDTAMERIFIARLDSELNKVNQFYQQKEKEFVEHADVLEKQMKAFHTLRKAMADSQRSSSHGSSDPSSRMPDRNASSQHHLATIDEGSASMDLPYYRPGNRSHQEDGDEDKSSQLGKRRNGNGLSITVPRKVVPMGVELQPTDEDSFLETEGPNRLHQGSPRIPLLTPTPTPTRTSTPRTSSSSPNRPHTSPTATSPDFALPTSRLLSLEAGHGVFEIPLTPRIQRPPSAANPTDGRGSIPPCGENQNEEEEEEEEEEEDHAEGNDDEKDEEEGGGRGRRKNSKEASLGRQLTKLQENVMMRLNLPVTTPRGSVVKAVGKVRRRVRSEKGGGGGEGDEDGSLRSMCGQQQELGVENVGSVNKKKLVLVERMLRDATMEYYRGLTLLRSFSSVNMTAFVKVLKKYGKISGHVGAQNTYFKAVESSHFNTSTTIADLLEKVEYMFTNHFAMKDRSKAMKTLRPPRRRASHVLTFIAGLFSGATLLLIIVYAILTHTLLPKYITQNPKGALVPESGPSQYLDDVFPIFALMALLLIHMYMYGINIFFWRHYKINYPFMFQFSPGSELRHREVLMLCSVFSTLLVGAMAAHLVLHSVSSSPYIDFMPLGLFTIIVLLLFCPLQIFYRSSRKFLLISFVHLMCAPLYKVVLADFFLGDQLTSQVPLLRNLNYTLCYYLSGHFRTGDGELCRTRSWYIGINYFVSLIPYWWRLMQCVRRYYDEKRDFHHVENGLKYFSALVAVAVRIQYGYTSTKLWFVLYIITSIVATCAQVYWDIVIDWGLLRRRSVNPWLRDRLIMPTKTWMYFVAIGLNVVLRLAWLQGITRFSFGGINQQITDFIFASCEVVRRGLWNFYRIENEHLNNVGKYRATRTVPLPFEDLNDED